MVPFPTIRTVFRVLMAATLFLAVALVAPLAGQDAWKVKAPERWTAEEALAILQDSPWTQEKDVNMPWRLPRDRRHWGPRIAGVGDSLGPESPFLDSARYRVRWESARPVRAAFERLSALGEELGAEYQSPPPSWREDRYIITVKAVRPPRAGREPFDRIGFHKLREAARLKTNGGEVKPVEVARSGMGASAALHFYFPRMNDKQPLVDPQGERVEFKLEVRHISLKTKFRLEPEWLR